MISRKFRVIYDDIAGEIISGNLKVGSYLPSEPQLSEQYQVSRETIRKALNLLTQEGMIQKIRGKGSLVLGQPISTITGSRDRIANSQQGNSTIQKQFKTIEFSQVKLSVKQFIQDPNEVLDYRNFYKVGQICFINKTPAYLKYTYLVSDLFTNLDEKDIEDDLDKFIERKEAFVIGFIKREIIIEAADFLDAQYLEIQAGDPLGVIKEKTYLKNSDLLMISSTKYTANNFRYSDFTSI